MNEKNKKSNIKNRIITAIVLASLIFLGLFTLPIISYGVVTAFILFVAAAEWPTIIGKPGKFNSLLFICALIVTMGLGLLFFLFKSYHDWVSYTVFILGFLLWLWLFRIVFKFENNPQLTKLPTILNVVVGLALFLYCWFGLNVIRDVSNGVYLVFYFLILVWGIDISAYTIGKFYGSKKLAPNVSPNKTWEGVYGALIFSIIMGIIAALVFPFSLPQRLGMIPLALICAIFAIIGDLSISVYKRWYNLKDTGALLPGHGGLLDRIDSLLSAAPIFALGLLILGIH